MKKIILSIALICLTEASQAYVHCKCDSYAGTTWTIIDYYVEGGCCSGVAVQGAPTGGIAILEQNQGNTWIEVSYNMMSNAAAQSACCPWHD